MRYFHFNLRLNENLGHKYITNECNNWLRN